MLGPRWRVLLFLAGLSVLKAEIINVTCTPSQECVLPCTFPPNSKVSILWIKVVKDSSIPVLSYDSVTNQDPKIHPLFAGRVDLVSRQPTEGNASLRLERVSLQDRGKYIGQIVSNGTETFQVVVNLELEARVSTISIRLEDNNLTCSSEGLYPRPQLTWSTEPPSNTSLEPTGGVLDTEQQRYNISSTVTLTDANRHHVHTCSISYGKEEKKKATWRLLRLDGGSSSELTLPGSALSGPPTVWKFNHSEIIAIWNASSGSYIVSEAWRGRVKVSPSGDLTLKDWRSSGVFTCQLTDAEGTSTIDHFVTSLPNTYIRLRPESSSLLQVLGGVGAVVGAAVVVGVVAVVLWKRRRLPALVQKLPFYGTCVSGNQSDSASPSTPRSNGPAPPPTPPSTGPASPSTPPSTGPASPLTQPLLGPPKATPTPHGPSSFLSSNQELESQCLINNELDGCRYRINKYSPTRQERVKRSLFPTDDDDDVGNSSSS